MDMLADKLGIDPLELRLKNVLVPGQSVSTGAIMKEWPFQGLWEDLRPHYQRAKKEAAAFQHGPIRRGVGLACHSFGIAQPGDAAMVVVERDPDNGITIYAACADPGAFRPRN